MKTTTRRTLALLFFALVPSISIAQTIDPAVLDELRKRYKHSFESIYVSDTALNNLSVHLRAQRTIEALTKTGTRLEVLQVLRKFLEQVANDRAFLQLELRALRAGYKKQSDASASIQQLPWKQTEVFHIAVLCDRYLQGQIRLAEFVKQMSAGGISVGESWAKFHEFRKDPYLPVVTMTEALTDFASLADKRESEVGALALKDPGTYNSIKTFKMYVSEPGVPSKLFFATDWPTAVKSQWIKKYRVLEGFAKVTDDSAIPVWHAQLDTLQRMEYGKLVRAMEGTRSQ
jgi:hypothetical protein